VLIRVNPRQVFLAEDLSLIDWVNLLLLALFLFPVAVYCAILGMINRRPQ
jgi:hypothetical protein